MTDGTASGTKPIAGNVIATGAGAVAPNGLLIFAATDGSLVATDGNTVTSFEAGSHDSPVATTTGIYYNTFTSTAPPLSGLSPPAVSFMFKVSDGTAAGTVPIALPTAPDATVFLPAVGPYDLTPFGNRMLFQSGDPTSIGNPRGLWITDGTTAGTFDLAPRIGPCEIVVDGSRAFVIGDAGVYVSDGTVAGNALVSSQTLPINVSPRFLLLLDPARVVVTGTYAQYALAPTAIGGLQIADTVANRDGSANYADARVVAFGDGIGVLDPTGNAEAVARIYEAAYHRAPDVPGLIAYMAAVDEGSISLTQLASQAAASPEFIAAYGTLSDAGFVTRIYENAAGRAPDAAGLASYTGALAAGASRGAMLLDAAASYEARQHSIGVAG